MKATDLMCNDWIFENTDPEGFDGFCSWVQHKVNAEDFKFWAENDWMESNDKAFSEFWRPIPLTPQILEKNGLNKCDDMEWCRVTHEVWEFGDNFYLYYDPYYNSFYIGTYIGDKNGSDFITDSIKIEYVHELQHALKLCGIEKEIVL